MRKWLATFLVRNVIWNIARFVKWLDPEDTKLTRKDTP